MQLTYKSESLRKSQKVSESRWQVLKSVTRSSFSETKLPNPLLKFSLEKYFLSQQQKQITISAFFKLKNPIWLLKMRLVSKIFFPGSSYWTFLIEQLCWALLGRSSCLKPLLSFGFWGARIVDFKLSVCFLISQPLFYNSWTKEMGSRRSFSSRGLI